MLRKLLKPDTDLLQVFIAAVVSAAILAIASPPVNFWPLLFIALCPIIVILHLRHWSYWSFAGACIGIFYAAFLVDGVTKWSLTAGLIFVSSVSCVFAFGFGMSGLLANHLPIRLRVYTLVLCWTILAYLLDQHLYFAIFLCAPISLASPALLHIVEVIGSFGLEACVLTANCIVAELLVRRDKASVYRCSANMIMLATTCILVGIIADLNNNTSTTGRLIGIQPNIPWSDYVASGWSLERRRMIEDRLDKLTRDAVKRESGTIVWPENGNGLANAQLSRRVKLMRQILQGGGHDLLAPGREFANGIEHLSVAQFDSTGITGHVRKTNLVPFAESGLTPGNPEVLTTSAGKLGISICFDSVFASHIAQLIELGAEGLLVTSDNASFGLSNVSIWHLAYSVLRASEYGRSMLYTSNTGPGASYNHITRSVTPISSADSQTIYEVELLLTQTTTIAQQGFRHLVPILCSVLLIIGIARYKIRGSSTTIKINLSHAAMLLLLIFPLGIMSDILIRSAHLDNGLTNVLTDLAYRAKGHPGIDALGPLFQQSTNNSCGAAALAFALTSLGDQVFEQDIVSLMPDIEQSGANLKQLANIAENRGFRAQGWQAKRINTIPHGSGIVNLVHLQWNHFVVAIKLIGDEVLLMDPAVGSILRIAQSELEKKWSGYVLSIQTRPVNAEVI